MSPPYLPTQPATPDGDPFKSWEAATRRLQEHITIEEVRAKKSSSKEKDVLSRERKMREREEMLARREEMVSRREKELDEEKRLMQTTVSGSDLVGINMGGEKVVTVKRSLLWQFEGTMLARMMSGRHEQSIDRDANGNVFLDYPPELVMPLIDFLRLYRDSASWEKPQMTPPGPEKRRAWNAMLNYFGFGKFVRQIDARSMDCQIDRPVGLPLGQDRMERHDRIGRQDIFLFQGVRRNVRISQLKGWTMISCEPYIRPTCFQDFTAPKDVPCKALLLGARHRGSDVLAVAAMGNANIVVQVRDDESLIEHNGAFWYCWREEAVGFAPSRDVTLDPNRGGDVADPDCTLRLSWDIKPDCGGRRAGKHTDWDIISAWEKVIFASDAGL